MARLRWMAAIGLGAALVALPARADDGPALGPQGGPAQGAPDLSPEAKQAEEMARRALQDLMNALTLFFHSIPQYDAPVINERGDIIIRRKNPLPPKPRSKPLPTVPGPVPKLDDSTRT